MSELCDQDFIAAVINIVQQTITNSLETNRNLEILSKETELITKNLTETIELRRTQLSLGNHGGLVPGLPALEDHSPWMPFL